MISEQLMFDNQVKICEPNAILFIISVEPMNKQWHISCELLFFFIVVFNLVNAALSGLMLFPEIVHVSFHHCYILPLLCSILVSITSYHRSNAC